MSPGEKALRAAKDPTSLVGLPQSFSGAVESAIDPLTAYLAYRGLKGKKTTPAPITQAAGTVGEAAKVVVKDKAKGVWDRIKGMVTKPPKEKVTTGKPDTTIPKPPEAPTQAPTAPTVTKAPTKADEAAEKALKLAAKRKEAQDKVARKALSDEEKKAMAEKLAKEANQKAARGKIPTRTPEEIIKSFEEKMRAKKIENLTNENMKKIAKEATEIYQRSIK
jgi:membrane-associated HD superfamily phosphohydrolase